MADTGGVHPPPVPITPILSKAGVRLEGIVCHFPLQRLSCNHSPLRRMFGGAASFGSPRRLRLGPPWEVIDMLLPFRRSSRRSTRAHRAWEVDSLLSPLSPVVREVLRPWLL